MTFLYGLYIIYKNQKKCFMASIQYNVCWICLYNNVWFLLHQFRQWRMYIFFYYGNMLAILIFIKQIIEKRKLKPDI